jgi:ATP-dependent Lon protease
MLGPPPFKISQIEEKDQIGLVTGLAWTQVGGELLCVETLTMPGKGKLNVTGKLGDVMKESAQAAVSFVRSRPRIWASTRNFYKNWICTSIFPKAPFPKTARRPVFPCVPRWCPR